MSEETWRYGTDPLQKLYTYYLTICTYEHLCTLGTITPRGFINLSTWGLEVSRTMPTISMSNPDIRIDHYVIMPNHVHLILSSKSLLEKKIREYVLDWKDTTSRQMHRAHAAKRPIWDSSFTLDYIRNKATYQAVLSFIHENPKKWQYDKFYSKTFSPYHS